MDLDQDAYLRRSAYHALLIEVEGYLRTQRHEPSTFLQGPLLYLKFEKYPMLIMFHQESTTEGVNLAATALASKLLGGELAGHVPIRGPAVITGLTKDLTAAPLDGETVSNLYAIAEDPDNADVAERLNPANFKIVPSVDQLKPVLEPIMSTTKDVQVPAPLEAEEKKPITTQEEVKAKLVEAVSAPKTEEKKAFAKKRTYEQRRASEVGEKKTKKSRGTKSRLTLAVKKK